MSFLCEVCNKKFQANFSLRRHYRVFHPDVPQPETLSKLRQQTTKESAEDTENGGKSGKPERIRYACSVCPMTFVYNYDLRRHVRKKHDPTQQPDALASGRKRKHPKKSPPEERYLLRRTANERVNLTFDNMTEFNKWKSLEEESQKCLFAKKKDHKNKNGTIRRFYNCHRSGTYRPHGKGIRKLKVQGTVKIGGNCPASMFVTLFQSGVLKVTYFPEHRNHEKEDKRMKPKKVKKDKKELNPKPPADETSPLLVGGEIPAVKKKRRNHKKAQPENNLVAAPVVDLSTVMSIPSLQPPMPVQPPVVMPQTVVNAPIQCNNVRIEFMTKMDAIRKICSEIVAEVELNPTLLTDVVFDNLSHVSSIIESMKKSQTLMPTMLPQIGLVQRPIIVTDYTYDPQNTFSGLLNFNHTYPTC